MFIARFFSEEQKQRIQAAIKQAELNTSGEIRVHIESRCKGDVLQQAIHVFEKLGMHATKDRNGVLFYLATRDRKFAIYGDKGIDEVVPSDFWNTIRNQMESLFHEQEFVEGLCAGIEMAGEKLKTFFPHQKEDTNELSDELSFGK